MSRARRDAVARRLRAVARHGAPLRRLAALLAAAAALAGCGAPTTGAALPASRIVKIDPPARAVSLLLVASTNGAFGGFNFDGYGNGQMTVTVPLGWQVDVTCTNASTVLTHSCAVVDDAPVSTSGARVAFGAATPDPTQGLPFHATARFRFVPSRPGRYRIACLVTAHEVDGMWDWLIVHRGGRPSIRT